MKQNLETLSTLFNNNLLFFGVDSQSKLSIDLNDDLNHNKRSHFRRIYGCILVGFNLYYDYDNVNDTLKKWHNEAATTYQFTSMLSPNL